MLSYFPRFEESRRRRRRRRRNGLQPQ